MCIRDSCNIGVTKFAPFFDTIKRSYRKGVVFYIMKKRILDVYKRQPLNRKIQVLSIEN